MNPFEVPVSSKKESLSVQDEVDMLIEQFPPELRNRAEMEIEAMDDMEARDYLTTWLLDRNAALEDEWLDMEGVVVLKEIPPALRSMIEESRNAEFLGAGKNAEVFADAEEDGICYKILFEEKARQLKKDILKEASIQSGVHNALDGKSDCAQVPEILTAANDGVLQMIMMEKIEGHSLAEIFDSENPAQFPANFDVDSCFKKIANAVTEMHRAGYFHKDLTNNAGNVIIDTEDQPWIIDFGAAVKSMDPNRPENSYQLVYGGVHFLEGDSRGVELLKERAINHLQNRE